MLTTGISCVGCGHCCLTASCMVGVKYYRIKGPIKQCPGLYWNAEQYICQLALKSDKFKQMLAIDYGCCQPLNTWRNNVKERRLIK